VYYVVSQLRPKIIVLIDGFFGNVPAVRHKEILWALSKGTQVFGAASMGAIRAAELGPVGMKGYGLIYRWYRAALLVDDDEVAVAMSPVELGCQPLSEALINIRITLRRAARAKVISGHVAASIEKLAESIHFHERSYEHLLWEGCSILRGVERDSLVTLRRWLMRNSVDQKEADAVGLLRLVAAADVEVAPVESKSLSMDLTRTWVSDLEASGFDTNKLFEEYR
jgi:hypothetical protein